MSINTYFKTREKKSVREHTTTTKKNKIRENEALLSDYIPIDRDPTKLLEARSRCVFEGWVRENQRCSV